MRWIDDGTDQIGWTADGAHSDLYAVSETDLHVFTPLPSMRLQGFAAEADAIEEWLRFHGLGPMDVMLDGPVVRDVERRQIHYPGDPARRSEKGCGLDMVGT